MPNTGNATPPEVEEALRQAATGWVTASSLDLAQFLGAAEQAFRQAVSHAEAPVLFEVPTMVDELCNELADAIGRFRDGAQGGRPAVTKRWRDDMRLLLDRGPLGSSEPVTINVDNVRGCIAVVFTELAEPEGSGTFCWAAQVQSPSALRRHWWKIRQAAMAKRDRVRQGKGAALTRHVERVTGVQAPGLAELMAAQQAGRLDELMAGQQALGAGA